MSETPRIFISYSWTTPSHEDWVINLAERLVSDGVDVTIDKWNLKEGHDKFDFMESMVKSPDINKVLIILDKKYSEKADSRSGGVGTETQIISPKIYENVSQEKFIPIVTEQDEDGKAYVPTFLEGRVYIDLSLQEHYEKNYETLLRNIYKRPAYSKPKLGKAPSYLFEETPMNHKTSSILRGFDNQVSKTPQKINSIIREFLEEFYDNLKGYSIVFSSNNNHVEIGRQICENITLYTPLRNDFISFFDKLTKDNFEFDIEVVIKFLERLPALKFPQDKRSSWSTHEFDNFRFFTHELFLYLIAIGIKNENFKFIEELLYSTYFFHEEYNYKSEPKKYDKFYSYVEIIKPYYDQTYSQNFYSPMADLIVKRVPENITANLLIEADLLCHYVGQLNRIEWFPITYIYKTGGRFELFDRFISLRHFTKAKILFGVITPIDLKEKLIKLEEKDKTLQPIRYSNSRESVTPLYRMIDIDKVATTR